MDDKGNLTDLEQFRFLMSFVKAGIRSVTGFDELLSASIFVSFFTWLDGLTGGKMTEMAASLTKDATPEQMAAAERLRQDAMRRLGSILNPAHN